VDGRIKRLRFSLTNGCVYKFLFDTCDRFFPNSDDGYLFNIDIVSSIRAKFRASAVLIVYQNTFISPRMKCRFKQKLAVNILKERRVDFDNIEIRHSLQPTT